MKQYILLLLTVLSFTFSNAQTNETYYVTGNKLNLRSETSTKSEVITQLDKYDNVILLEETLSDWVKIKVDNQEGYVAKMYIKKGKAQVRSNDTRTGAICHDGTSSSATGRGACSHHGGVDYWLYKTNTTVDIIN